jgi:glycosyltransferase involved in cell wall biosynthesis
MRLAFILPRFGPQILGGAETHGREVIEQLVRRGHYVEVWTTCVRNIYTWANEYPSGAEQYNGIAIHRFPICIGRPFDLWVESLSRENQYRWVDSLAHSPQLYAHIAAHSDAFDGLIFMPYIVGTTYYGARIFPQKSIVWACLHDEWTAYLTPTRDLLCSVAGLIFNTWPEQELVVRKLGVRHPNTVVAGMGFDIPLGDAAAFRRAYPHIAEQFVVYAGRLEQGKNVDQLIRYFLEYRSRHSPELDLVLLGQGPLGDKKFSGVVPLGFVDEATKRNALAAATFLCQPSLTESLSIVLMEAWSQNKPVLVQEQCPVTVDHVRQSQGGLYFANYGDFEGATEYLLTHPTQAEAMGINGHKYVQRNYNWQVVMDRLEQALESWLERAR